MNALCILPAERPFSICRWLLLLLLPVSIAGCSKAEPPVAAVDQAPEKLSGEPADVDQRAEEEEMSGDSPEPGSLRDDEFRSSHVGVIAKVTD